MGDELDLNKTQVTHYGEEWFEGTKIFKIDDEIIQQLSRSSDRVTRFGQKEKTNGQQHESSMPLLIAPLEDTDEEKFNSTEEKKRIGSVYKSIKENEYEKYEETTSEEKIYDYLYDVNVNYGKRKEKMSSRTSRIRKKESLVLYCCF